MSFCEWLLGLFSCFLSFLSVLSVLSALSAFCLLCIDVRCVFLGAWVWGYGSHLSVCFVDDFCGVFRILVIGSVDRYINGNANHCTDCGAGEYSDAYNADEAQGSGGRAQDDHS